ncbi:MAG: hypothetical protein LBP30_04070 [Clostridiales Family XIII bacterium]|nr:hypothetical protein [Clostridiales Family XIII bacterium]
MAKTSTVTICTDNETKKEIEYLYGRFGLTVSDAVNIFFNKSIWQTRARRRVLTSATGSAAARSRASELFYTAIIHIFHRYFMSVSFGPRRATLFAI